MNHNLIGASVATVMGLAVAFVNYLLSKKVLIKTPEKYSFVTVARQILQIGFLALVYLVCAKTRFADPMYPLIGAVLGMTVPMLFFTKKLLNINGASAINKNEKEAEIDG